MVHRGLIALLRGLPAWALGRRRLVRVEGLSMGRAVPAGGWAWCDLAAYRRGVPAAGDLVLVRHPLVAGTSLVKRVARVEPDGRLLVLGDDPERSTDSRHFGPVARSLLRGRIEPLSF